jgi:hypothetical protein
MADLGLIPGAATRNSPPDVDDFGLVVRNAGPLGPITFAPGTLHNGHETVVGAAAVSVLAAPVAPLVRTAAIVQNTGTANIRVGVAGVTATTGVRLPPGFALELNNPNCPQEELFAIREGLLDSVAFAEEST